MPIDTRDAAPTDVATILGLDEIARTESGRAAFIRAAVGADGCVVAEDGGRTVGYGVLEYSFFGHGFVSMVYVVRDARRHGVGAALLGALGRRCTTAKLFTSTNASNLPMQALLVKSGFELSGIIHNLDPGDPELVYVRMLEAGRG